VAVYASTIDGDTVELAENVGDTPDAVLANVHSCRRGTRATAEYGWTSPEHVWVELADGGRVRWDRVVLLDVEEPDGPALHRRYFDALSTTLDVTERPTGIMGAVA